MAQDNAITFTAEVKKVSSKTLVSLDKEYEAVFRSPESALMELGVLDAQTLLKVTVEVVE